MADQPRPGDGGEQTPHPQPTGTAPAGPTPGGTATPSPQPQVNPYPVYPGMLPGIDPARKGYTVHPELLLPAANRADGAGEALKGLADGLALGAPAGLGGFQTAWQAGVLADQWSHELGSLSQAVRTCAAKIRATTKAYYEAEASNAGNLR